MNFWLITFFVILGCYTIYKLINSCCVNEEIEYIEIPLYKDIESNKFYKNNIN